MRRDGHGCYTRRMLWLVPHLFADPHLLEAALPGLRLPGLARLLGRGAPLKEPATDMETALCQALGIARQLDWPLAAVTYRADGGLPGNDFILRADPVHLAVMRDRVVCSADAAADISMADAMALAAALTAHFGDAMRLEVRHPTRWYLRLPHRPHLVTASPSHSEGRTLDAILPRGDDAPTWRTRINEAQMVLHDHEVNRAREQHGSLPVNSVWLWGGGYLPPVAPGPCVLVAADDDALAHSLAPWTPAPCRCRPPRYVPGALDAQSLVILDQLRLPAHTQDVLGWRMALAVLDADWFTPLAANLRHLPPAGLRLFDPTSGRGCHLDTRSAWRLWRRPADLAHALH